MEKSSITDFYTMMKKICSNGKNKIDFLQSIYVFFNQNCLNTTLKMGKIMASSKEFMDFIVDQLRRTPDTEKKMIRPLKTTDLDIVMQIWLDGNLQAHYFIASEYWQQNYDFVKQMLPQSKVYVYEDEKSNQIKGFIGLQDEFIAGVFVQRDARAQGIGKQLLNYAKSLNHSLRLSVYQKNELAYKFYKQNEFEVIREQLDDVTNEKEFLMQWQKK